MAGAMATIQALKHSDMSQVYCLQDLHEELA
jgi:hypothetical protein